MNGYFYWCGVVINGMMALALLFAIGCSIAQWLDDLRDDRYFRHTESEAYYCGRKLHGSEGDVEGTNPAAGGEARSTAEHFGIGSTKPGSN